MPKSITAPVYQTGAAILSDGVDASDYTAKDTYREVLIDLSQRSANGMAAPPMDFALRFGTIACWRGNCGWPRLGVQNDRRL